jgi:hypothetical protein
MPEGSCLSTSLFAELIRNERCETSFPVSNGFMREEKATFQEYLRQIPQAQLVAQPPKNNEKHNIGGVFQKVERSCSPSLKARWHAEQRNVS